MTVSQSSLGHLEQQVVAGHAGVVDQHGRRAELAGDLARRRARRRPRRCTSAPTASGADARSARSLRRCPDADASSRSRHRDGEAVGAEPLRDRGADAAAGTGDDRDELLGRLVRRVGSHAALSTGRPVTTAPTGSSSYSRSTRCARRASTRRWLTYPLSVISPASSPAGRLITSSRSTRPDDPRWPPAGAGRRPGARPAVGDELAVDAGSGPAAAPTSAGCSHTSALTSSRPSPVMTASVSSPGTPTAAAAAACPTLTKVPVDSLKSSAMRPRNSSPARDVVRVGERDRVAGAEEALLVERGRGQVGPAGGSRA